MGITTSQGYSRIDTLLRDISFYSDKIKSKGRSGEEGSAKGDYGEWSFFSQPEVDKRNSRLSGSLAFSAQELASQKDYVKFSRPSRSYAVESYEAAYKYEKKSRVIPGIVHEYNRNFNFKI